MPTIILEDRIMYVIRIEWKSHPHPSTSEDHHTNIRRLFSLRGSTKGVDGLLYGCRSSTNKTVDQLAALEKIESRHCAHSKLLGDIRNIVDIHLVELDIRGIVAPGLNMR